MVTGGKVSCVSLWMSLLKTLRKDAVGEKALADALQEKYGINVMIMPGMYEAMARCRVQLHEEKYSWLHQTCHLT